MTVCKSSKENTITTITFNAFAYKSTFCDLDRIVKGEEMPSIWAHESDTYPKIGKATVTVELFGKDEIHSLQLANLNHLLQEVRAENQRKENAILDQISKLQAIGYEVTV